MTCRTPRRPLPPCAFSLVEVLLALGVFSLLGLALLGLLGNGLQSARDIQRDYQTTLILENLRSRCLLEPDFPPLTSGGQAEIPCDESGMAVPAAQAQFLARFRRVQPPHWQGRFLEAFLVELCRPDGEKITSFLVQRAVDAGNASKGQR